MPREVRQVAEPNVDDLMRAAEVVSRYLKPTPLVASAAYGDGVLLKLESLQPTGSFKVRGGLAAVAHAKAEDPRAEVVTASAGNHGLGVAYAAKVLGLKATVVIPEGASLTKRLRLQRFKEDGIDLVLQGSNYDEAEEFALDLALRGAVYVSAYNDPHVIAGQSTIAFEVFDQAPDTASFLVPVGGGGLISGIALAANTKHGVDVIGIEAAQSPAVSTSVRAGNVVEIPNKRTIADGLAGNVEKGSVTIPIIARLVSSFIPIEEDTMRRSIRQLALDEGVVAEASGAVAYAAIEMRPVPPPEGPPTVAVISGRNIAAGYLAEYLAQEP
jgi:threonine dehydratase